MRRCRGLFLPNLLGKTSSRKRRELALVFALVFGATGGAGSAAAASVPFSSLQTVSVAADDARSVAAGDLDGDGDLDLVSVSYADNRIAWYENTTGSGSFGPQKTIALQVVGAQKVEAADLDGDGDLDLLAASRSSEAVSWFENTDGRGSFSSGQLIGDDHVGLRRAYAVDLEGDGDLDVVAVSEADDKLSWYENTNGAASFASQVVISTEDNGIQEAAIGDLDGDGDLDIAVISAIDQEVAWYRHLGSASFASQATIGAVANPRSIAAGDLDGDGDLDLVVGRSDKVVWFENNGVGSFASEQTIVSSFDGVEALGVADLDADGDLDVFGGNGQNSGNGYRVSWFENFGGASSFAAPVALTTDALAIHSVIAADLDGDGDLDLASASGLDDRVAWLRNQTLHRSACFPAAESVASGMTISSIDLADLDGDGDLDLAAAWADSVELLWYPNLGDGSFGAKQVKPGPPASFVVVRAADLNEDGDQDLLWAEVTNHKIAWSEGTGGGLFGGGVTISTEVLGVTDLVAVDLDGDGDLDVVSASEGDDKVAWYRNLGGGSFAAQQVISSTAGLAQAVAVADLDRDGDLDVLSASEDDNEVAWYENLGGGAFGSAQALATDLTDASSVAAADLDEDGDLDVVAVSLVQGGQVDWILNTDGAATFAEAILFLEGAGARGVRPVDLDRDGDPDVVVEASSAPSLQWWEQGGGGYFYANPLAITTAETGVTSTAFGDLDRDGDLDIVSAVGDTIYRHENRGGQYALPTRATAQRVLANGQRDAVLRIDLESRGRVSDLDVVLETLVLRFTDDFLFASPLSSAQANALIEKLEIFLDDDSGTFEPSQDQLIQTLETLTLSEGLGAELSGWETIDLTGKGIQDGVFTSKRLFVVVTLTADAASQSPDGFQVSHLASSASARYSLVDIAVDQEPSVDVGSGVISTELSGATCWGPYDLDLVDFSVSSTLTCTAGTVLGAGDGFEVAGGGDLTLRSGRTVVLRSGFRVASSGTLKIEIDPDLQP